MIKATPDTTGTKNQQTQNKDDLATKLHGRWDPDYVEESQEEIVQGGSSVHIGDADARVLGNQSPACSRIVFSK